MPYNPNFCTGTLIFASIILHRLKRLKQFLYLVITSAHLHWEEATVGSGAIEATWLHFSAKAGAPQGSHFGGGGGEGGLRGRRWRRSQWERHLRGLGAGLFHPIESFTCSWRNNTGINIFPALHHFPSTFWKVVVWYQISFCPGMRIRMAKQFRQRTHTSVKDSDLGN